MNDLYFKRKSIDSIKKLKKVSGSTVLVLEEAERNNIEWKKIAYCNIFRLTYKDKPEYFHGQIPSTTTEFAHYCCANKRISKNILDKNGLSVSNGYRIEFDDKKPYLKRLFENLKKPLVVKPVDDQQGNNVYLNIKTWKEYIAVIQDIYDFYGQKEVEILVEEMFQGEEYRILATQNKILSVIKRLPANVVGDGKSSIKELIIKKNLDPLREKVTIYQKIKVDKKIFEYLKKQNLRLSSVLPMNKRIFLRPHNALNISLGGDTIDVTDEVHPSVKKIVKKIMLSVPGLALTGIDYMTKNIFEEQTADNYKIIEINSSPCLEWNEFPIVGPHRRVAFEFLKLMFPELE